VTLNQPSPSILFFLLCNNLNNALIVQETLGTILLQLEASGTMTQGQKHPEPTTQGQKISNCNHQST
jgi:hypothetical protein